MKGVADRDEADDVLGDGEAGDGGPKHHHWGGAHPPAR